MKKILLDTHFFVWMITKSEKIQVKIQQLIEAASKEQRLCLSTISLWEIATLVGKERLKLTMPIRSWIERSITTSGIRVY